MELNDLYRDVILDHNRRPRNFGALESADASVEGFNPMCGDRLTVRLKMDDDKISDIRFEGQGCAISTASASLNPASTSTASSLPGRSRTWPIEARTSKRSPKNRFRVLALAGDSTMINPSGTSLLYIPSRPCFFPDRLLGGQSYARSLPLRNARM